MKDTNMNANQIENKQANKVRDMIAQAMVSNLIACGRFNEIASRDNPAELSLEVWPEGARPLTQSGRDEIAAESAAVARIVRAACECANALGFEFPKAPENSGKADNGILLSWTFATVEVEDSL